MHFALAMNLVSFLVAICYPISLVEGQQDFNIQELENLTNVISLTAKSFEGKTANKQHLVLFYIKRSTIIGKYELGFTQFLKRNDFKYDFWFKDNIHDYPDNYYCTKWKG